MEVYTLTGYMVFEDRDNEYGDVEIPTGKELTGIPETLPIRWRQKRPCGGKT